MKLNLKDKNCQDANIRDAYQNLALLRAQSVAHFANMHITHQLHDTLIKTPSKFANNIIGFQSESGD